mgnify:CR=1 FL=1
MKFNQIVSKYNTPDKHEVTGTTSLKFKEDVFNFFYPKSKDQTVVEFGSFRGHFTQLFSDMFNKVYAVDHVSNHFYDENTKDLTNVTKYIHDLYKEKISKLNLRDIDVIVIDAVHSYPAVRKDTVSCQKILKPNGYIIYDDYGAYTEVKHAVNTMVVDNIIKIVKEVGESEGYSYKEGHQLNASEGVIAQLV